MADIKVGDRVAYARHFLRSICAFTGAIPFARGVVESIDAKHGSAIATIAWRKDTADWQPDALPARVNVANLVRVDRIPLEDR